MSNLLTLKQWEEASIEQRSYWLAHNYNLTPLSQQILNWAEEFRAVGASISGKHLIDLWTQIIETET